MNAKPLVTIYMPTYNRLTLLKRAVKSVLEQDYRNIELIIVDDGSNDGTVEYLYSLSQHDDRVRCVFNEENSGACVSRNHAIFSAKGEFITGLDDDDYFTQGRISNFVNSWLESPHKQISLHSNNSVLVGAGKKRKTHKPKKITHDLLIYSNYIGNQLFTKTVFLKGIGGFDVKLPAWQDLDCWYRLLKNNNGYSRLVENNTYVVDVTHPHERISNSKIDKINYSCDHLIRKYNLSTRDKRLLRIQADLYVRSFCKINDAIYRLSTKFSLRNVAFLLKSMIGVFNYTLKKLLQRII